MLDCRSLTALASKSGEAATAKARSRDPVFQGLTLGAPAREGAGCGSPPPARRSDAEELEDGVGRSGVEAGAGGGRSHRRATGRPGRYGR